MKIDSRYGYLQDLLDDIVNIKIQGATALAESVVKSTSLIYDRGLEQGYEGLKLFDYIIDGLIILSTARTNEPLAENYIRYLKYVIKSNIGVIYGTLNGLGMRDILEFATSSYLGMISESKAKIVELGLPVLGQFSNILTHCHSSTAVKFIKESHLNDSNLLVYTSETRPLYQGRKTAVELLENGIETVLIADSTAESLIIGTIGKSVDVILVGCDEITKGGDLINKIGTLGIALASKLVEKPMYVVTTLLKINPDLERENIEMEQRSGDELWSDAPSELHIYNPAFDIVENYLVSAFMTEAGIIEPSGIYELAKQRYPWLDESISSI